MKIFANNFRGFRNVEVDFEKLTILVGDNSSGKSTILHLLDSVVRSNLNDAPKLNEDLGVGEYDYFSPYFDFDDVTFGYIKDEGDNKISKIITVKQQKDQRPKVLLCSYYFKNLFVTLKISGKKFLTRIEKDVDIKSSRDLLVLHNINTGFKEAKGIPHVWPLSSPAVLFLASKNEGETSNNGLNRSFAIKFLDETNWPATRLIAPLRAPPENYYSPRKKIDSQGLHFASMFHDAAIESGGPLAEAIDAFGKESKLFDKILVTRMDSSIPGSPLVVRVRRNEKNFFLTQVGVGISQVVPVLVEAVFALNEKFPKFVLIQQPELHLHPIAQSALGAYFYRVANAGLRGVIETHSSFLIDRIRAEIRDAKIRTSVSSFDADKIEILFCQNKNEGNIAITVQISADGKLNGEPEEYHNFFVDEMLRTIF